MDALTPDGPLFRTTWFLMRVSRPIRDPCLLCRTFRPFCLQPPYAVPVRIWIFCTGLTVEILCRRNRVLADRAYQASPLTSRLATATGRIEFVNLRTGRSPPVALHPASRRRSYLRLRETRHSSTRTHTSPIRQHHRRTSPLAPREESANDNHQTHRYLSLLLSSRGARGLLQILPNDFAPQFFPKPMATIRADSTGIRPSSRSVSAT